MFLSVTLIDKISRQPALAKGKGSGTISCNLEKYQILLLELFLVMARLSR